MPAKPARRRAAAKVAEKLAAPLEKKIVAAYATLSPDLTRKRIFPSRDYRWDGGEAAGAIKLLEKGLLLRAPMGLVFWQDSVRRFLKELG